jgi:hypothetical protein
VIDHHYLQFKAIDLDNCHFILRQKSTPRAITQWLRQDISTLHLKETEGGEVNYCSFKVKERAPSLLGRKRKHSEVNSDDMEPWCRTITHLNNNSYYICSSYLQVIIMILIFSYVYCSVQVVIWPYLYCLIRSTRRLVTCMCMCSIWYKALSKIKCCTSWPTRSIIILWVWRIRICSIIGLSAAIPVWGPPRPYFLWGYTLYYVSLWGGIPISILVARYWNVCRPGSNHAPGSDIIMDLFQDFIKV